MLINSQLSWLAGQRKKKFLSPIFREYGRRTAFTRAAETCEKSAFELFVTVVHSLNRARLEINAHRWFPLFWFNRWPIIQEVKRKPFLNTRSHLCTVAHANPNQEVRNYRGRHNAHKYTVTLVVLKKWSEHMDKKKLCQIMPNLLF